MPLWRVFSHPDIFSESQRDALAADITDLYVNHVKLPPFYVNVLFVDLDEDHTYVGGKRTKTFVRIVVEQIARTMPDPSTETGAAYRKAWLDRIHRMLKPHILDREELQLELHIYETPKDLWRIQGLEAPPPHSEAEQLWREKNMPIPWQEETNSVKAST